MALALSVQQKLNKIILDLLGEEIDPGGSFWPSEEIEGGHFGEVRR